jgi:hypothetical protein
MDTTCVIYYFYLITKLQYKMNKSIKAFVICLTFATIASAQQHNGRRMGKRGEWPVAAKTESTHAPIQSQTGEVRVKLLSLWCHKVDDQGKDEEIYGKCWALNANEYGGVRQARQAFRQDEILKKANNGMLWRANRDQFITLRKNQSFYFNKEAIISYKKGDKIVLLGDLDERDYRNSDDILNGAGTQDYIVLDPTQLQPNVIYNLIFHAGGTSVSMQLKVEQIK